MSFRTTHSRPIWLSRKDWITRIQIIQFVTSLVSFVVYVHIAVGATLPESLRGPVQSLARLAGVDAAGGADWGQCAGFAAVVFNLAFNATLLLGFVDVLSVNTKSATTAAGAGRPKSD